MAEATILHADLDAFYASVEQRDDPALRGRPVLVGMGVVLAASYEAKAYGVRTPMGLTQARQLCPHAIAVPPRMSAYSTASKAVFAVFRDTTPIVIGSPTRSRTSARSRVAISVGVPRIFSRPPTSRNASSIEMPSTIGVVSRNTAKTALLAAE